MDDRTGQLTEAHVKNNNKTGQMSNQDSREAVPDGGWGLMIVFASFLANLVTNGIAYSLGIFYFEFLVFYKSGKGETAWLGSLVPALTLLFGRQITAIQNTCINISF